MQKISKNNAVEKYGVSYQASWAGIAGLEIGRRNHDELLRRLNSLAKMTITNEVNVVEVLGTAGAPDIKTLLNEQTSQYHERYKNVLSALGEMQADEEIQVELKKAREGARQNSEALLNAYEAAQAKIPELQEALKHPVVSKLEEFLPEEIFLPSNVADVGDRVYIADIKPNDVTCSTLRSATVTERIFDESFPIFDDDLSLVLRYKFKPCADGGLGGKPYIRTREIEISGLIGDIAGEDLYDRSSVPAKKIVSLVFNSEAAAQEHIRSLAQAQLDETRAKSQTLETFLGLKPQ